MQSGGEKLDYLLTPTRSMTGLMPFNPLRGIGRHERTWTRILRALPLLLMSMAAFGAMYSLAPFEEAAAILGNDRYNNIELLDRFYHIPLLDDFSRGSPLRSIISGMHFFSSYSLSSPTMGCGTGSC
ncbi:hypothetical protein BJY01DRAFT_224774 [Aspergillus pseudoustus]|uniref:Mannosyltransferase n=1 Tax=Aspergillus pseudoustus TaxID=1810923 RepID=A0ABR4J1U1_9EURO